jgi:hypothetical protein
MTGKLQPVESLTDWTNVTAKLPAGAQHALFDALCLVKDGDIKMVWGQDDYQGYPCLVNAVRNMLTHSSTDTPSHMYGQLVGMFDTVNRELQSRGINKDHFVSPMAAEILVYYFAPLADRSKVLEAQARAAAKAEARAKDAEIIPERNDDEILSDWLDAMQQVAEEEECAPVTPVESVQRDNVESV